MESTEECLGPADSSDHSLDASVEGPAVSKHLSVQGGRGIRIFALLAAFVMVSIAFGVVATPARASAVGLPTSSSAAATPGLAYGPGTAVTVSPAEARVSDLGTFERWDGSYQPLSTLNLSSGNWPYVLQPGTASFTVSRLGASFTQTRVPGAAYDFQPDEVKETIVLNSSSAAPADLLSVGFSSTYIMLVHGPTAYLLNQTGTVVWQTAPFTAWDSSPVPQVFANPVASVYLSLTGLVLRLDPKMIVDAQYPLYLDPTWVVKGSTTNGWTGTLDGVTNDRGDANLRLGVLADDFNDNVNEIWTVTSGHSFSLSGGKASLTATEIHASGSWTNLTLGVTLNFASCGASNLFFRYVSSSNDYYLAVDFANQQVTLKKVISGTTTAISPTLSIPMSVNTNYDVKVVAQGNSFQIWWAGVEKWSGTDASPPGSPLSGNVGISETTSKCALTVDNVRARDPAKWSGNYTSVARGTASGNVATQVRYLGAADAYNSADLWINSSSDNVTWGGWHLVKSMAAPALYYPVPDADQRRYYQVRAVLRTGVDGTPSVSEIDVAEAAPPSNVIATTNTGHASWYPFIGGIVNAVSGNLVFTSTDLSIQAKGGSIAIVRTYNSLLASTSGPFGLGTTDIYHQKLAFPSGGNVTWTDADGASYTFVTMGGSAYSPPPGVHDNLIKNTNGSYTIWAPDGSRMNFDSAGHLTSLVDRNGNHQTLTYTNGNPTRVSDDSGLSLTLTYDGGNRVLSVVDPVSRGVSYTYGPPSCANCLAMFTDPMLSTENYSYDASGHLTFRLDRAGHVDRFVYDGRGRVSEMWAGEWNVTSSRFQWQVKEYTIAYPSGTQTTATNALGGVTTITLNSQGNPTNLSGPSVGCTLCSGGNSTAYAWDGEYNPLAVTDGRGDTTTHAFDWMGNLLSSRDPGGNTTTETFLNVENTTAFLSLLTSLTTPKGFTTRYTYYANGNLYATILPGTGSNTSYRFYDAAGSLTRLQDFRGSSVTYGYDGHEFHTSSADAGGNTTIYQNDALGRTWNVTSPGGNVTRQVYDLDNRVSSTTDPMGNTTLYAYDKDGRATQVTDPNNLISTTAYNLTFGSVLRRVSAGGNLTNYSYDAMGDAVRMTDANRHASTYAFDAYRRMATSTTPLSEVTRFVYDAAGNLATKIEANGTVVRFTYDRSDRLTRTTFPGGATETSTHDADGNVVEKRAFNLDDFYKYDAQERVIQTRQVFLDTTLTVWHNYTYDQDGNRVRMDGPGGGNYTWDKNNRISTQTDASGHVWRYTYGREGQLLKQTSPDGEYELYAYDKDGHLISDRAFQSNGILLETFNYTFDKVGDRLSERAYQTSQATQFHYTGGSSAATSTLTVAGLSPSSQTVTVVVTGTVWLDASANYQVPNCPTSNVTWSYVLDGVSHQIGFQSVYVGGTYLCKKGTLGTFSTSITLKATDTLYGLVAFENDSNVAGSVTSLSISYQAWYAQSTYAYDKEYRLRQSSTLGGAVQNYTYDAVGNRRTATSGGSGITYSYNTDDELTSSTDGYSYAYDANENLISRTLGSVTTHYAYDYANDLSPVLTTQSVSSSQDLQSTCAGCITTTTVTLPALVPSPQNNAISVSASGWLTDTLDYPNCPSDTVTWSYLLNGVSHQLGSQVVTLSPNSRLLTCRGSFSGTYPSGQIPMYSGNHLAGQVQTDTMGGVVTISGSASFTAGTFNVAPYVAIQYGPDGLRSSEVINDGPTSQRFGYDLAGLGGAPEKTSDYTGTALANQYVFSVGVDTPLEMYNGTTFFLYHRDALGSITSITDYTGTVDGSYSYDAWGNLLQSADTMSNLLRYTASPYDPTLGLVYDRARWYDPSTGRFLTPEPMGGGYAYAADSPTNNVDPSGLSPYAIAGGGSGGGCTMAMFLAGQCFRPIVSSGGSGSSKASDPQHNLKCMAIEAGMIIDVVAGILFGVPISFVPGAAAGIIWSLASSTMPSIGLAWATGDIVGVLSQIGQFALGVFAAWLTTLDFFTGLAKVAQLTIGWAVSLSLALLALGIDYLGYVNEGC